MPDIPLDQLVARLNHFPQLRESATLTQLQSFLSLSTRLLPSIRSDKVNVGLTSPSDLTLPGPVVAFLASSLQLSASIVILCWAAFGDLAGQPTTLINEDEMLSSLGTQFGIAGDTLEPPTHCTTDMCDDAPLTKHREYQGIFFTLCRGVLPITIASMYCQRMSIGANNLLPVNIFIAKMVIVKSDRILVRGMASRSGGWPSCHLFSWCTRSCI